MPICDRCHHQTNSIIMSIFDTEMICPECKKKERQHPEYEKARDVELSEVLKGNYNFIGIGKPEDL